MPNKPVKNKTPINANHFFIIVLQVFDACEFERMCLHILSTKFASKMNFAVKNKFFTLVPSNTFVQRLTEM